MDPHPAIGLVSFMVGTWRGEGSGEYPTIDPFRYTEEISFRPGPGKPFLVYSQRTARAETGEPLHSEAGYLRVLEDGGLEFVIAQPTGIVELHTGTLDGSRLRFEGSAHPTPGARDVSATVREITVDGDRLEYRLAMAAVGQPLTHHLHAVLRRVDG